MGRTEGFATAVVMGDDLRPDHAAVKTTLHGDCLALDGDEAAFAPRTGIDEGAPAAVRWTKHSLNNWIRAQWPSFEASLAFGILGFTGPEAKEGLAALVEKRPPSFEQRSFI